MGDRWIGPALSLLLRCDVLKVRRRSVILPLVEGISATNWGRSLGWACASSLLFRFVIIHSFFRQEERTSKPIVAWPSETASAQSDYQPDFSHITQEGETS
jgi:hypothetical protein